MILHCASCEAPYVTTLVNAERFSTARCRACRRAEHVEAREIPTVRVFGREVDMGRWFAGVLDVHGWRITK